MPNVKQKLPLIVEKANEGLWGRVIVKGNLIVDSATNLEALKRQVKKLVLELENVVVQELEVSYDLTSFFDQHSYLNISEVASKAGINPVLMRQYASGIKFPSEDRVKEIENAIRSIGKELARVKLHKLQPA